MDDLAVIYDGGVAVWQVKSGLKLESSPKSPFAAAVGQMVSQALGGTLMDGRPFDLGADLLVLCTDSAASATVREVLPGAIRRCASQPFGTDLIQNQSKQERDALGRFFEHVRRSWNQIVGLDPTDDEIRNLLRATFVVHLNSRAGHPHDLASELTDIVDPSSTRAAASALVGIAHQAAETKQWLDFESLRKALDALGIATDPAREARSDIDRLQDISRANHRDFLKQTSVTSKLIQIARDVEEAATSRIRSGESLLIVGEAGAGKTGLIARVAEEVSGHGPICVLRASDLYRDLGTQSPLDVVLAKWSNRGTVFIDGLDAARSRDDRQNLVAALRRIGMNDWSVVASIRRFDLDRNPELLAMFAGWNGGIASLPVLVGELSDSEVEQASKGSTVIAGLLDSASEPFRHILLNAFNLRLASELVESNPALDENVREAVTQLELLDLYMIHRVQGASQVERLRTVSVLAAEMLRSRSLQIDLLSIQPLSQLDALASDGVVRFSDESPLTTTVEFTHNLLFDYIAAFTVLWRPSTAKSLIAQIDEDPVLSLIARPSIDLIFERIWGKAKELKDLLTRSSRSGHVLLSLALARNLVGKKPSGEALVKLVGPSEETNVELVGAIIGVYRSHHLTSDADARELEGPLSALAVSIAVKSNADNARELAVQVAELLLALRVRVPTWSEDVTVRDLRAQALSMLLEEGLLKPNEYEPLVDAVGADIKAGISHPLVQAAAKQIISSPVAIKVWGGTILTPLADAITGMPAALALRVVKLIFRFEEHRSESVSIGFSSVMPMNESRRQQAEHSRWVVQESFPDLVRRDLSMAAHVLAVVADAESRSFSAPRKLALEFSALGVSGRLQRWSFWTLNHTADLKVMTSALSTALWSASSSKRIPALRVLVRSLSSGRVWAALLGDVDESAREGIALLRDGALLASPDSSTQAGQLAGRILALGDPSVRSELLEAVLSAVTLVEKLALPSFNVRALLSLFEPVEIPPQFKSKAVDQAFSNSFADDSEPGFRMRPDRSSRAQPKWLAKVPKGVRILFREATTGVGGLPLDAMVRVSSNVGSISTLPEEALRKFLESVRDHPWKGQPLGAEESNALISAIEDCLANAPAGHLGDGYWSSGPADLAIEAAGALVRAFSPRAKAMRRLTAVIEQGMTHPSPLVRMQAMSVLGSAYGKDVEGFKSRLLRAFEVEGESSVIASGLRYLAWAIRRGDVQWTDDALRVLAQGPAEHIFSEQSEGAGRHDMVSQELVTSLVVVLDVRFETPFARETVDGWFNDPQSHELFLHHAIFDLRDYLGSTDRRESSRAFQLMRIMSDFASSRWRARPEDPSETELAVLKLAMTIAHDVCQQIYFASGAYDDKTDAAVRRSSSINDFAVAAIPILETCAQVSISQVIHSAVESLIYFSSALPRDVLLCVSRVIPDQHAYVADPIGGPELSRYLAGLTSSQQGIVLEDDVALEAFRRLLQSLAFGRNAEALELAFGFAETFR